MNRELKRLSIFVLILIVSLLVSTSIIQVFTADTLKADPRNTRTLYESYEVERGPILVNGEAIASSTASDDVYNWQRSYSNGALYAPVTGFFPVNGEPTGLEGAMNLYLSGTANAQFFNSVERIFTGQKPKGAAVNTTIDPVAQQAAWDALGNQAGSVVVTEPATGRIVALVSKPSFDPNTLAVHDSKKVSSTYKDLVADQSDPLLDDNIDQTYHPGSTFKLVVASAALESGDYTPDSEFPNPQSLTLTGTNTSITNSGGATCGDGATATLATALRLSCNIPMAELAEQLGDDAIRAQAEKYGFNNDYAMPMKVAKSVYPQSANVPQTQLSGFGQWDVTATPLQIAMVSAAIANKGIVMKPTVVGQVTSPSLAVVEPAKTEEFGRAISEKTAAEMVTMMVADVDSGAASNARIDGVDVAGKTGTAENGGNEPYTLWFTGFAPADDPQYAITVLLENGGGMGQTGYGNLVAAPIAKKVLEAVLNK